MCICVCVCIQYTKHNWRKEIDFQYLIWLAVCTTPRAVDVTHRSALSLRENLLTLTHRHEEEEEPVRWERGSRDRVTLRQVRYYSNISAREDLKNWTQIKAYERISIQKKKYRLISYICHINFKSIEENISRETFPSLPSRSLLFADSLNIFILFILFPPKKCPLLI